MMCTYNQGHYISEAIESVLSQDVSDWELLILDDASTDDTEKKVSPYLIDTRIRYIKHPHNLGLGGNRIAGLREARGTYVAILDSDDRWNNPTKLSRQKTFLDEHPDYGVVGTFANTIDEAGQKRGSFSFEQDAEAIKHKMLLRDQIINSSSLFRRDLALEVGGYTEALAPAEDYDLFLRMGIKSKFSNIPEYLTDYRIHTHNSSGKNKLRHARLHLDIITAYKKEYPNYLLALIKAYARIILTMSDIVK